MRPVRRPRGLQRAAPPRPARRGDAHRLHPPEAGAGEGQLPASVAPGGAGAHLRRHHLPGAGDADRERARRLLARGSGRASQSGREEGPGADHGRAGTLRGARGGERPRAPRRRGNRRPDRDVRPLRLQQVALGRLLDPLLPDGVAQDPLSRGVHGRAAVLRDRRHRQGGAVHQRGAGAGPRGPRPRRQRVRVQVHRRRGPADPLRPRRHQERGRRRHRVDPRGSARRALSLAGRLVRPHRPAALQQTRPRGADRCGRVRLAGRSSGAARRRPRCVVRRGPDAPAGALRRAGRHVRRHDPGPASRVPPPGRRSLDGARAAGA